ncbi:MAG: InlB B-repeat-containing protein [Lachnospiraceae bacterium]|nr:InlB B-repeat-containing protein [Lachnospiraceae bacterium]
MKKILLSICLIMFILFSGEDTKVFASGIELSRLNGLEPLTVLEMTEGQEVVEPKSAQTAENGMDWQQYGSKYFYNQLNETEQKWWDTLDALGMRYLTGTESLTEQDSYTMEDGYVMEYFITPAVAYTGITPERAREILYMFKYSNPQYYFFQTMVYSSADAGGMSGMYRLTLYPAFADGTKRAEITAEFKRKITAWVDIVAAEETELAKEKAAYDLICQNISYDVNYQDITLRNEYDQSIYSVFFTESTVCAGYSQTMQLLMNAVGIDCAAVTGVGHEWNIIRLQDTWYNVDVTWGDLDEEANKQRYIYFNRSDSVIQSSHTALDYWKACMPACIYDSGADFDSIGTIYTPTVRLQLPVIQIQGGMATISAESGAEVYYTLDGSIPSVAAGKADKYQSAFAIKDGQSIQAVAVKNASWDSEIAAYDVKSVTYTVQFYTYSGSKVESQEVLEGGTVKQPSMPVWSGHQFCGWYKDASYQQPYDFNTVVATDMVLYAKWIAGTYAVRFYSNGGTDVSAQYIEERKKAAKPANPVRNGYVFEGWYTDTALTRKYNFATPILADLNLYAKWQGLSYPLKLDANGGYIGKKSIVARIENVCNGDFYRNMPDAKRKGYRFLGWFTKKNGGEQIVNGSKVFQTKALVLYAKWEEIVLPKASIVSAKSKAAGSMRIKIKKNAKALGYQIRYSLEPSMKSAKKIKSQKTIKEISKLKKGKTYYVQVRLYQKDSVGKKMVFGAWSNTKTVKIKK